MYQHTTLDFLEDLLYALNCKGNDVEHVLQHLKILMKNPVIFFEHRWLHNISSKVPKKLNVKMSTFSIKLNSIANNTNSYLKNLLTLKFSQHF